MDEAADSIRFRPTAMAEHQGHGQTPRLRQAQGSEDGPTPSEAGCEAVPGLQRGLW